MVEFLGMEEEEGVLIVLNWDDLEWVWKDLDVFLYIYLEIDVFYIFGLGVLVILFLDYN